MNLQISVQEYQKLVQEKVLRCAKSTKYKLIIWNYLKRNCGVWGIVKNTRGLVTDYDGNVVARSFPKFDKSAMQNKTCDFTVMTKYDGSLILIFNHGGEWIVTSRGSFDSKHRAFASEIFSSVNRNQLDHEVCYSFELIHPNTRIKVNYGKMVALILLGAFKRDGTEIWPLPVIDGIQNCEIVQSEPLSTLMERNLSNHEGYVVRLQDGTRSKLKFADWLTTPLFDASGPIDVESYWLKTSKCGDEMDEEIREHYSVLDEKLSDLENEICSVFEGIKDLCAADFAQEAKKFSFVQFLWTLKSKKQISKFSLKKLLLNNCTVH